MRRGVPVPWRLGLVLLMAVLLVIFVWSVAS